MRGGVELYELKVDAVEGSFASAGTVSRLTLHTKALVFDKRILFVGSLNMDPRSIEINSEMGLFIDSPTVVAWIADSLGEDLAASTYRLGLDDQGNLRWTYAHEGTREVWYHEPKASFGRRFSSNFCRMWPIERQL